MRYIFPPTGKDATEAFASVGHSQDAVDLRDGTYLIGTLRK
jgi:cytochrome b involved in lipid metabolism